MSAEEQRIREFAYQIWESEGRPTGQEARHWEMARKLAESETRGERPPAPKPRRVSKPKEVPTSTPTEALAAPPAPRKPRAAKAATEEKPALLKKPRAAKATPKAPKA
ncbi:MULTISPECIES: DUF2934 domain-containing protein [unclassified Pseudomonas]|uniref:DUF2934 domain-containing protein n=1 Tax=unclassified Pseudomonas TaxID=196821 RepID=UPI000DA86611|nr:MULTISPECIES: DUF2934 domain-containing protein [unclassified Pseudomonas]MDW3715791.1 DUF2934 domain-containing protein [Pseudomonas sp. 2023EL-01195]PZE09794.1 hypothetical protein DMX10_29290 [Pseudomonas sp. 57B-090624]